VSYRHSGRTLQVVTGIMEELDKLRVCVTGLIGGLTNYGFFFFLWAVKIQVGMT
jgi:hypothetical protein